MSIFNELLAKVIQKSDTTHSNLQDEYEAALECLHKFEREFLNGRVSAREKAQKDKNLTTTLQSIHEDGDESNKLSDPKTLPNGSIQDDNAKSSTDSGSSRRRSKKRSKDEVEGINSPELDKRLKRNASVKARTVITKQVQVNLTQKLRREDSTEKPRASRRRKEEDKENGVPNIPPVQIKQEKISLPPEPMETDCVPLTTAVKQELDRDIMPPPVAPLPKARKTQKEKEKDKETEKESDDETGSRKRTTRTRKRTDVDSMPPPQVPSSRATRASSRASSRAARHTEAEESAPVQPTETRPKSTRTKKKVSESSTDSEIASTENAMGSPAAQPRPKRTRRGKKAAEAETQKQVDPPAEELQIPDKQQDKPKEPDLKNQKPKETSSEQKEPQKQTTKEQNTTINKTVLKDTQLEATEKSDVESISLKEERISQPEITSPLLQKPKTNNNIKKVTKQDLDEIKKSAKSKIPRGKKVVEVESQSSVESVQDVEDETRNTKIQSQESDDGTKIAKESSKYAKATSKTVTEIESQSSKDIPDSEDAKKTAKANKYAKATSKTVTKIESQSSEDILDSQDTKKTAKANNKSAKLADKNAKVADKKANLDSQNSEEVVEVNSVDKLMLEETRVLDKCNTTVTLDMDKTVILPNGVYNHAPVTPKDVQNNKANETVVLEKCRESIFIEKHAIMDCTVVLEKAPVQTAPKLTDDNSLLTDDNDSGADFQTPPKDASKVQPSSAVKEKVQKFEELAARTTRTKTRAMAKMDDQDNSTPPDKIIKPVLSTESLNKMNNLIFNGKYVSNSACKPRVLPPPTKMAAASASKATSIGKFKEAADEASRREKEKEDAIKKKEALLEAKREAQRRRREEKMAAAAAARAATEESRRRAMEALARDRMEKQAHADQGKIERLKEVEKKKLELARKVAETEERRKAEEQARAQRLADEQRRAEMARRRQLEEQALLKKEEAKMAKEIEKRQKEYLDKQKMKRSEDTKSYTPLKPLGHHQMEPVYMEDGFQYLNSDEESESNVMPVPQWSMFKVRRIALAVQADVSAELIAKLFSVRRHSPDLREIFPAIERNRLKRTSSAVWRTPPPRLPALKE